MELAQVLYKVGLKVVLAFGVLFPSRFSHDLRSATPHVDHESASVCRELVDEKTELASDQHAVKSTVDEQRLLQ